MDSVALGLAGLGNDMREGHLVFSLCLFDRHIEDKDNRCNMT